MWGFTFAVLSFGCCRENANESSCVRESKETRMKVNVYSLDWQVKRLEAKSELALPTKLAVGCAHFYAEQTFEAKERVLNWLDGLALGIKKRDPEGALLVAQKRHEILYEPTYKHEPTNRKPKWRYGEVVLRALANDLLHRQLNWAKDGYSQKDLDNFIMEIADYLGNDKLKKLVRKHQRLARESRAGGKRHKFIY
jgi:hypothetical protein